MSTHDSNSGLQAADWQEREQGRDPRHSYIVQAPAGSGKTELLTQRMLGLLAHVENPEEVIAITFTRKAAAEMSHRLLGRLRSAEAAQAGAVENEGLKPHEQTSRELALAALENDKARGWNLLQQPSRLRIRTIDSLCSELSRQLPVLSGLGGGQQVTEDATALYRRAAAQTMAAIEDSGDPLKDDVTRVLDRYDNQYDKLVDLLTGMLASRDQWTPHLLAARRGDGFDRRGLEEALRYLVEIQLEEARRLTPDVVLSELPRFYHYALGNGTIHEAELNAMLKACGGADCDFLDLATTAEALPHWKALVRSLLTQAGEMRKSAPGAKEGFPTNSSVKGEEKARLIALKSDFSKLLDQQRGNIALLEAYKAIRLLPNPDYENESWESLESLMRIMQRAVAMWKIVMAETGEVDYGEISQRAIEALGDEDAPSELALRMDYRIQHLLVDEFQDTSSSQIRLLKQLTAGWSDADGRTLFLVGDPMQSIYRFRKAEVSLFIQAWQGQLFDHIQLRTLQLQVNFRSTKPIVDWVNQVFPVIMPRHDDPLMGAVSYSKSAIAPGASNEGTLAIKILPDRDDEEEARLVADAIGQCDVDESVAILVRSRTHASEILSELDRRKQAESRYRYQAIKFTRMSDTSLIRDLVSLTLALIQPADRLAWLSTLRAPYIGLDLADLDELVAGDAANVLLDAIISNGVTAKGHGLLSTKGQQRLQRTAPVLLEAVKRRGKQSVRSVVESCWIKLGGPACVENASELDDAATYFDLLDSLEDENLPIDHDTLDLRMDKLWAEPDADANGNLQVLTMYEAKGLQFDTVILPGLNREPPNDDPKLLYWFELAGRERIVMSPMRNIKENEQQKKSGDLIKYIANVEKKRKSLEDSRLLYVASTRAVHSLYIFAAIKPSTKDVIKAKTTSLMGSLWPAIEDEQTPLIRAAAVAAVKNEVALNEDEQETASKALNLPRDYRRLAAGWQLPPSPKAVQLVKSDQVETQDSIDFDWAGEDARLTGNLVHRLLQLIGEAGLEKFNADGGMVKHTNWCRQYLVSVGVHDTKADDIIKRASQAIRSCLASEQGRWILENHEEANCEYAITAVFDSRPTNLVLDRTFIQDGTRWIIDYKTSSHGGGNLDGFLQSEIKRYREQLQRYRDAVAMTESRPIKTALYFPLLDRLCEV